jgi:hypothetical protein
MPDMTIEYMQECQERFKVHNVDGHTVIAYEDGDTECDCADFKFRRRPKGEVCKHIDKLNKSLCFWHEQFGKPQTEEQKKNHVCPECGGKTKTVKVAV